MAVHLANFIQSHAQLSLRAAILLAGAATALCAPTSEARSDVVTDWNVIAFNTIPPSVQGPPQARIVAYVQAAVFDAVNSIERKYTPFAIDLPAPAGASPEAAAAAAAHGVLAKFYPAQKAVLDASLEKTLSAIANEPSKVEGLTFGHAVAQHFHEMSLKDGADASSPAYTPGKDLWSWQYTAPGMEPRGLTWGSIKPFVLKSPTQFRYPGPLEVTSAEYGREIDEVRRKGGGQSSERTADETAAAIFWVVSMPAIFNDTARNEAKVKKTTLVENARLFALLNLAASDSQVAAWSQKFSANFLRPVTAIRNARKIGVRGVQEESDWAPLLVTPAHPDYPSGHCAYGGAAVKTLQLFFGTDAVDASYTFPAGGMTRRWRSYTEMGKEVGEARIWGGIHTRTADEHAHAIGEKIAEYAFENFMRPNAPAN
jgi:hypothetical protein